MNKQFSTPGGTYFYEIQSNSISILSYEGDEHYLVLPDVLDGFAVTSIAPKAFLGKKQVEQLILPISVTSIGDWAFSHMTKLKSISFPAREITLGKQIFMDCPMLTEIKLQPTANNDISHCYTNACFSEHDPALPYYMAAILMILKNTLLFRPSDAGNDKWYSEFDAALCRFLERPDDDGFEPVYLGWFEDEDVMATQYPRYVQKKRLEKAALSLKRLRFPNALNDNTKAVYEDYIRTHMDIGVWECLLAPGYVDDCAYLNILTSLNCIGEDNIDKCIADLNVVGATQAVAALLHYKDSFLQTSDFFDNLTL